MRWIWLEEPTVVCMVLLVALTGFLAYLASAMGHPPTVGELLAILTAVAAVMTPLLRSQVSPAPSGFEEDEREAQRPPGVKGDK